MKIGTETNKKFKKLRVLTGLPLWQLKGLLQSLWDYTAQNSPLGDIGRDSNEDICLGIEYSGDPDAIIGALVKSGFLDEHPDPQIRLVVHDWHEHCETWVKKRVGRSGKRFLTEPSAAGQPSGDIGGHRETPDATGAQQQPPADAAAQNQEKPEKTTETSDAGRPWSDTGSHRQTKGPVRMPTACLADADADAIADAYAMPKADPISPRVVPRPPEPDRPDRLSAKSAQPDPKARDPVSVASIVGNLALRPEPLTLEARWLALEPDPTKARGLVARRIRDLEAQPGGTAFLEDLFDEIRNRADPRFCSSKGYTGPIDSAGAWLNGQTLDWLRERGKAKGKA